MKRLATADSIPFPELFSYNRKQLDAYQEESCNQQRLAFRQAQRATIAGLIILTVGIVLSFGQSFGAGQYAAASLAGLGAALSAFIANTFAKSAREANQQLNLYYREPHMVGRVMVTEHLAQELSDEFKPEQLSAMIAALLAWPLPGDPPTLQGEGSKVK
ncbi:TRADD-N-associated membrane domain-containing protein [Pseudarthrobacter sulfonivorans]|uniref:TRADD-N-associated membrane domain-containing protein n=1 Tax=Pseudarthrobacter sulfonivorans TaxID=121292 RepID=UPI00285E80BE|nr:hypothetical protein [Pseudarthrobacter sulfonivorans]MDR6414922.1 drug/metabolite transporter (DMT)-like permease [Pseudarthrobacter sulfonivorans]